MNYLDLSNVSRAGLLQALLNIVIDSRYFVDFVTIGAFPGLEFNLFVVAVVANLLTIQQMLCCMIVPSICSCRDRTPFPRPLDLSCTHSRLSFFVANILPENCCLLNCQSDLRDDKIDVYRANGRS